MHYIEAGFRIARGRHTQPPRICAQIMARSEPLSACSLQPGCLRCSSSNTCTAVNNPNAYALINGRVVPNAGFTRGPHNTAVRCAVCPPPTTRLVSSSLSLITTRSCIDRICMLCNRYCQMHLCISAHMHQCLVRCICECTRRDGRMSPPYCRTFCAHASVGSVSARRICVMQHDSARLQTSVQKISASECRLIRCMQLCCHDMPSVSDSCPI